MSYCIPITCFQSYPTACWWNINRTHLLQINLNYTAYDDSDNEAGNIFG